MTNDTTRAMPMVEEIEAMADRLIDDGCSHPTFDDLEQAEKTLRAIADQMRKSESVASWWCAIEFSETEDDLEEIAMSWNVGDANGSEAARTEANQWINDQPHPGSFHLVKVYAFMKEDSHDH